jgi:hypothetical protein
MFIANNTVVYHQRKKLLRESGADLDWNLIDDYRHCGGCRIPEVRMGETMKTPADKPRFDYLTPAQGPVVDGLEDHEKIYALEQADYLPIRTLQGERGRSAIYRVEMSQQQRQMVADGADVLVEILHFGGPLAPSRVMLLDQQNVEHKENWVNWLIAQFKLLRRSES